MEPLPDWIGKGAVVHVQGGSDAVSSHTTLSKTELNFSNRQRILIQRLSIAIDAEYLENVPQFPHFPHFPHF